MHPKGPGGAALHAMLESEYAFAGKAQISVSGAFLDYLAEDSWVLHPGPEPGRPIYQAAKDFGNKLDWYPAVADIAPSGDLVSRGSCDQGRMGRSCARPIGRFDLAVWRGAAHRRQQAQYPCLCADLAVRCEGRELGPAGAARQKIAAGGRFSHRSFDLAAANDAWTD